MISVMVQGVPPVLQVVGVSDLEDVVGDLMSHEDVAGAIHRYPGRLRR